MSSDLIVGSPTTTVLTSDLEELAQDLEFVHGELLECSARLAFADRFVTEAQLWLTDAPYSAVLAEEAIDRAQRSVAAGAVSSEGLVMGLRSVVLQYESLENQLERAHESLTGLIGYGVAWLLPGLALVAAPLLLPSAVGAGLGVLLLPDDARQRAVQNVLALAHAKAAILTDPATVELVRLAVSTADDAMMGGAHVPFGIAGLLGDDGFGVAGIASSTAVVGGAAASVGLLRETPVVVRVASVQHAVAPANGVHDRIERIPVDDAQIRIDRYESPGKPDRVEVFIAGTATLGAVTGAEPWDMTSNISAMGGGTSGSTRAVLEAMSVAGVTAETPVVFTGYSQGGLIAAQIAASGDWNTTGLVTVGAPAGQVAVPHNVAYLAIEHTDDLVPALGGRFEHSQPLVVRREFFDGPVDLSEKLLPAHELDNYARTAALVDREPDARIRSIVDRLSNDGYTVTSTTYRAERVL